MCMSAWYHPIALVLLGVFYNIADAQYEGNSCNHTSKGTQGICKKIDECLSAIQDLRLGVYPQNCGFNGTIPIVCCTSDPKVATAVTTTTTTKTTTTSPPPPTTTATTTTTTATTTTKKFGIDQLQVGEKSRRACESYKMLAYKKVNSTFGDETELIENCPWQHGSVGVAIEGILAQEAEFPHMVLIVYGIPLTKYNVGCGGSLISEKFVLTAAHCVIRIDGPPIAVRLGDLNYADPDDDKYVQQINIKDLFVHSLYKYYEKINDIALLELEHSVQLNLHVKPICLYRWDPVMKVRSAMVAGWGSNGKLHEHTKLFKGVTQYFSTEVCNRIFTTPVDIDRHIDRHIDPETQICFGRNEEKHVDTCRGDSGVPLQIYNKDVYCSYYAFAITSFGRGCGKVGTPSVYTNIYPYLEWIEGIVWPS